MRHTTANPAQLGFDSWLAEADEDNDRFRFLKTVEHLPNTWAKALPYYRALIKRYHAAMLETDEDEVLRLKDEAHDLAAKLNGGTSFGICPPDGFGRKLEEAATRSDGQPPRWGQAGNFTIDHEGMAVRIEIEGLFGIGALTDLWPGFTAHAVDRHKPFISDTGFQSFLGCCDAECVYGMTPEQFVDEMIACYIDTALDGKLMKIKTSRAMAA